MSSGLYLRRIRLPSDLFPPIDNTFILNFICESCAIRCHRARHCRVRARVTKPNAISRM